MATHSLHEEESHGSYRGYVIGFVLSVVLTAASFWVGTHGLSANDALLGLAALAFVQIIVHLIFFLHLSTDSSQRWNVMAFAFTVMTALIVIGGTVWIMHNVAMNMMIR